MEIGASSVHRFLKEENRKIFTEVFQCWKKRHLNNLSLHLWCIKIGKLLNAKTESVIEKNQLSVKYNSQEHIADIEM